MASPAPAVESDPLERSLFDAGDNYAIVVGIDEYRIAAPLNYAVADATRLAGLLETQGYTVDLITDYEASPDIILERIRTIGEIATDDGREVRGNLVFAFSGHGFREGDENYLATNGTDPATLAATALSMTDVKEALRDSGVRRRTAFIDACRNDPGRGLERPNQSFNRDDRSEGLAILYSTGPGALSWEDPELGQGVFSYFLAQGLSGEAAGDAGYVTFENLYRYVRAGVGDYVFREFNRKQVPYTGGERTGTFVLGRVAPDSGAPPPEPSKRRGWAIAGAVVGVVVLGVLAAGGSGGGSGGGSAGGSDTTGPVTLVVPTP